MHINRFFYILFVYYSIFNLSTSSAQNANVKSPTAKVDSINMPKTNTNKSNDANFVGVSVTPSTLRYSTKPGFVETKEIKISNDTKSTQRFKVSFSDFSMNRKGKPGAINEQDLKYALSKKISISPSYIELKPGETQKLLVTLKIPSGDEGAIAGWTIISIDQEKEKSTLSSQGGNDQTVSFGVKATYGFGVFVYHTPPNVINHNIEIQDFKYLSNNEGKKLAMVVKNVGDGIGFCNTYVEMLNIKTGKKTKLGLKSFKILPQLEREFEYNIPSDLTPGDYTTTGVVDYGNENDLKIAELSIKVE